MEGKTPISAAFEAAISYARAGERTRAVLIQLKATIDSLGHLVEIEPALEPEITAALEHLDEAGAAIGRAGSFLTAQLDARLEQLGGSQ